MRTGDEVKPTEEMTYDLYSFSLFYEDFGDIIREQYASGVLTEYEYDEGFTVPWWASFLPYLLIMAAAMGLWYVMMNTKKKEMSWITFVALALLFLKNENTAPIFKSLNIYDEELDNFLMFEQSAL